MYSLNEGKELISLARKSINYFLVTNSVYSAKLTNFQEKRGLFVTLHSYDPAELETLPGIRCIICGHRILLKKRPPIIKRLKTD